MLGINTNIAWPKTSGSVFTQAASDNTGSKSPFGGAWRVPNMIWNAIQGGVPAATPIDDGMAAAAQVAQAEADARAKFGPEQAALNLQRNIIERNLSRGGGLRQGPDYRGHELDLQMLDKELAQLGIDREAAGRQPGLLEALFGITSKQYQGDLGYLDQLAGFNQVNKGNALNRAGMQRDLNNRAAWSDATARGAIVSAGHRETLDDIMKQYGLNVDDINLTYNQTAAGLEDKRRTLGNQYEGDTLNYNENKQQAQDRIRALDIEAEKYGIKREQLENAFQRGIQALGIQNQIDVESLGDMLASNDIQQQMLARQIADQALRWAG